MIYLCDQRICLFFGKGSALMPNAAQATVTLKHLAAAIAEQHELAKRWLWMSCCRCGRRWKPRSTSRGVIWNGSARLGGGGEIKRRGRPPGGAGRVSAMKGVKVPPKYRGPGGEAWAGRGAYQRGGIRSRNSLSRGRVARLRLPRQRRWSRRKGSRREPVMPKRRAAAAE